MKMKHRLFFISIESLESLEPHGVRIDSVSKVSIPKNRYRLTALVRHSLDSVGHYFRWLLPSFWLDFRVWACENLYTLKD
jgi:hypothetical protein